MENTNEVQNEDGKPEIIKNKDDKEFTCDLCEKIFKRRWNLQRHAKLCTGKIVCAVCSEEFQTKRLLERHGIKQHAVKLVYRCHVCGRNYRRPDKYQLHKKKCADRYEADSMFSDYDEDDSRGGDPLKLVTNNLFSKKFDLYDYKQEKLC